MQVIKPTPSQAAVVLKNFFESKGVTVGLGLAQEGVARVEGYTSFNALAAAKDPRGRDKQPKKVNGPTLELWAIVGRLLGDDDDTLHMVWGRDISEASGHFRQCILDDNDWTEEELEANRGEIIVTSSELVGISKDGSFVLEKAHQPFAISKVPAAVKVVKASACCKQCDTPLNAEGFCGDDTCSFSDWPQNVDRAVLATMSKETVERTFGVKKRVRDADAPLNLVPEAYSLTLGYFQDRVAENNGELVVSVRDEKLRHTARALANVCQRSLLKDWQYQPDETQVVATATGTLLRLVLTKRYNEVFDIEVHLGVTAGGFSARVHVSTPNSRGVREPHWTWAIPPDDKKEVLLKTLNRVIEAVDKMEMELPNEAAKLAFYRS